MSEAGAQPDGVAGGGNLKSWGLVVGSLGHWRQVPKRFGNSLFLLGDKGNNCALRACRNVPPHPLYFQAVALQ